MLCSSGERGADLSEHVSPQQMSLIVWLNLYDHKDEHSSPDSSQPVSALEIGFGLWTSVESSLSAFPVVPPCPAILYHINSFFALLVCLCIYKGLFLNWKALCDTCTLY